MSEVPQYGTLPQYGAPVEQSVSRKRRRRPIIALVVLVLVVAGIGYAAWSAHRSNPDSAKVNDCVSKPKDDAIKVVGCGDGAAAFKVVGKVENKTQVDVSLNSARICKPFAGTTSAYWKGKIGKPGYVLCLAPVK